MAEGCPKLILKAFYSLFMFFPDNLQQLVPTLCVGMNPGRSASSVLGNRKTSTGDAERPICIPTQSVGTRVLYSSYRDVYYSFPRSAWECRLDDLRPLCWATEKRAQGTQSVPYAFPRKAWEREFFIAHTEMCITISAEHENSINLYQTLLNLNPTRSSVP